jgi:hypothetical protein
VGHPAASRVQAGQFDEAVQSISANRRCALHRKVTSDRDALGREERMKPVDNLRIEIRMRSTAQRGYSVRERSTIWRKLNRGAAGWVQPRKNLESRIKWIPHPRQWVFFSLTTKPAEMLSFYPGADRISLSGSYPYATLFAQVLATIEASGFST